MYRVTKSNASFDDAFHPAAYLLNAARMLRSHVHQQAIEFLVVRHVDTNESRMITARCYVRSPRSTPIAGHEPIRSSSRRIRYLSLVHVKPIRKIKARRRDAFDRWKYFSRARPSFSRKNQCSLLKYPLATSSPAHQKTCGGQRTNIPRWRPHGLFSFRNIPLPFAGPAVNTNVVCRTFLDFCRTFSSSSSAWIKAQPAVSWHVW